MRSHDVRRVRVAGNSTLRHILLFIHSCLQRFHIHVEVVQEDVDVAHAVHIGHMKQTTYTTQMALLQRQAWNLQEDLFLIC